MKNLIYLLISCTLLWTSCGNGTSSSKTPETGVSSSIQKLDLTHIKNPVGQGGEPNLVVSPSGRAYLSWVEYVNDSTDALMFTKMVNAQWTPPKEIARGNNWFVNWADFPSLVVYQNNENHLAAHWLQKRAAGTYDYDVRIAQSKDGGDTWSASFIPHTDGIAAEHGFVTMIPTRDNKIFATWLDGRLTKTEGKEKSHNDHGHGHGGAMTLRTATFDIDGNLSEEAQLDAKICDCCQTSATIINGEPLVVYRDRSDEEVRDISFVKKQNTKWTQPATVHSDNWKTASCPVNGPAIATNENQTAVAWFAMSEGQPMVQVAYFDRSKNEFGKPIRIDDGKPVGRVGIVIFKKTAYVTWLENLGDTAEIRMAIVTPEGKNQSVTISKSSISRSSGFPQVQRIGDRLVFAWTVVNESSSMAETSDDSISSSNSETASEYSSTVKTALWKIQDL